MYEGLLAVDSNLVIRPSSKFVRLFNLQLIFVMGVDSMASSISVAF